MKSLHRSRGYRARAFTLIELMVVIAIILVLATMVVGGLGWYKRKAAEGKTTVLVGSVSRALEDYRLDNGFFPEGGGGDDSTLQVYIALYGDAELESDGSGVITVKGTPDGKPDDGNTVYLDSLDPDLTGTKSNVVSSGSSYKIVDAWGEPLHYRHDPSGNDNNMMNPDFDLWSLGADGKGGPNTGTKKERADDIKNW